MATTAFKPSIDQIEQARSSIQNGWTHGCREERRREAYTRLDWLARQLGNQNSPAARSTHSEPETGKLSADRN